MTPELTQHDLRWLAYNLADRLSDPEDDQEGYDCVMTSIGYVSLWCDGEVGADYDGEPLVLDPDSAHSHCPVCGWTYTGPRRLCALGGCHCGDNQ